MSEKWGLLLIGLFTMAGCASERHPETPAEAAREVARDVTPERLEEFGDVATELGDMTRAEEYYAAALRRGGEAQRLTRKLVVSCVADSRYPLARVHAAEYVRRHPGDTRMRYILASLELASGNREQAVAEYTHVVHERPDFAAARFALGTLLLTGQGSGERRPRAPSRVPEAPAARRLRRGGPRLAHLRSRAMTSRAFFEQTLLGFLAPVRPYLDDATVTEVMINGPFEIFVERNGRLERTPARFENREALIAAVRNLSQYVGKVVSEDQPILEGRLPDGSRIEAILPPASHDGPHVSIRRFAREMLTIDRLVARGALSSAAARALGAYVRGKVNILVAGGTGTGKTSVLNALSGAIPSGERVIVIEDTREVQLQGDHVVCLEARPPGPKGKGEISMRDLFRASLRMRPDRVIVGEVRGGEALEIVQAMTSGHGGCMGTLHAATPRDALGRLETMCLMSDVALPLAAMRTQIGSAIQVIVQMSRLESGSRKVTRVSEVLGYDSVAGQYLVSDLFRRDYTSEAAGLLLPTGERSSLVEQLTAHGVAPPPELVGETELRRAS
jgi:pilus assembly protein CpaF